MQLSRYINIEQVNVLLPARLFIASTLLSVRRRHLSFKN